MYSSNVQDCISQNYFKRSNGNKGNVFVVSYHLYEFWVEKTLILLVGFCHINATLLHILLFCGGEQTCFNIEVFIC